MRVLLVVYDNQAYISEFPIGLAYVAAVLRRKGHQVKIYSQDKHHYPDEHLTGFLDQEQFDAVGVSVVGGYYQYRKLLSLSRAINASKNRPPYYIIGGHGPSPEPEFFLKKTLADIAVIGEGEDTVIDLVEKLEADGTPAGVLGIAYRDKTGSFHINRRRPLIRNVDAVPFPAYDLFPIDYYRLMRMPRSETTDFVMPVLSGRGCLFRCAFCYRMDEGFRPRSPDGLVDEIGLLMKDYGVTYIAFYDELLMSSTKRAMELCDKFIQSKLKFKWSCNGRLNYAKPDVLKRMKEAGCVFINYGIEAIDDYVLKIMNKALTVKQVISGVENTLQSGISPGLNIIFGNIGDTKETLKRGVEFLLKYDDHAQMRTIRPVTPYPGCPLYYRAIESGLLKDAEDFYEHKHVNSDLLSVNFTDMGDQDFHEALLEANTELLRNYYKHQQSSAIESARDLYLRRSPDFRGFRTT